jgi:DNA-directed RNA polymerase specialized sigma24 family protein
VAQHISTLIFSAPRMLYATLYRGADQKQRAKLHSVSVSTVKRRLNHARHQIRKQLGLS